MRHVSKLALLALLAIVAVPSLATAQEFPRDEVDEALDDLATQRAQELNQAYFDYEMELEEARQAAQRSDDPSVYETRRADLRAQLEARVTRIERAYEARRADILYGEESSRPEIREVAGRFGLPEPSDQGVPANDHISDTAERNDRVALAWAEFNAAADSVHAKAERTGDWSDYEATLTRLEEEYHETIAAIERRYREARFEQLRERRMNRSGDE